MSVNLNRRSFIIGTGAISMTALLAACTTTGGAPSGGGGGSGGRVALPDYVPYEGIAPDIAGTKAGIPDVFLKYPASPVTATKGVPGDGSKMAASVPFANTIPAMNGSNSYWVELQRRMGVDLDLSITAAGDYPARFSTAAAGGKLGDMFNVPPNVNGLPGFLRSQAADLTPYLSGSAVRDYPFLANLPTTSWRGTVFNEGIYAIPISRGVQSSAVLYVREDLVRRTGLNSKPKNIDELTELAAALTSEKDNRWGLASVPMDNLQGMLNVPNHWAKRGGKLVSNYESDGYLEALSAGAKLIKKGYVHPDSLATEAANQKNWFNGGTAAMISDSYTASFGYCLNSTVGDEFELGVATLPGHMWLGAPNNSIAAIKKGSEQRVRALLKIANWLAAPFGTEEYQFLHFGQEGIDFQFTDGEPVLTDKGIAQMGNTFPIEYLAAGPRPLYLPGFADVSKRLRAHMDAVAGDAVGDPTYGYYSNTNASQGGSLTTRMVDATNAILAGRKPVSSWKSAVSSWRSSGGDRIRGEFEKALSDA